MKVSIIIPYKEDRGYLLEAIASCRHQTDFIHGKDYEVILSFGGSLGANINNALARAKGEYIKICPDDDKLTPNCLQTLYTYAKLHDLDFVCANAVEFGDKEGLQRSSLPRRVHDLAVNNSIHGGTILYRKSAMPRWREDAWTGEEYWVSLRMAADGCRFGYVDETVFLYRRHPDQKSGGGDIPWYKGPDGLYRFEYIENIKNRFLENRQLINSPHTS